MYTYTMEYIFENPNTQNVEKWLALVVEKDSAATQFNALLGLTMAVGEAIAFWNHFIEFGDLCVKVKSADIKKWVRLCANCREHISHLVSLTNILEICGVGDWENQLLASIEFSLGMLVDSRDLVDSIGKARVILVDKLNQRLNDLESLLSKYEEMQVNPSRNSLKSFFGIQYERYKVENLRFCKNELRKIKADYATKAFYREKVTEQIEKLRIKIDEKGYLRDWEYFFNNEVPYKWDKTKIGRYLYHHQDEFEKNEDLDEFFDLVESWKFWQTELSKLPIENRVALAEQKEQQLWNDLNELFVPEFAQNRDEVENLIRILREKEPFISDNCGKNKGKTWARVAVVFYQKGIIGRRVNKALFGRVIAELFPHLKEKNIEQIVKNFEDVKEDTSAHNLNNIEEIKEWFSSIASCNPKNESKTS